MFARSLGVARSSSRACRITLYSSPRSTNVVTMREPSIGLQRAADGRQRDAEIGGAVAVDGHLQLRLARVVVGIEFVSPGFSAARQHDVAPARELRVVGAAEHDLHRRTEPRMPSRPASRHCAHARQVRQHRRGCAAAICCADPCARPSPTSDSTTRAVFTSPPPPKLPMRDSDARARCPSRPRAARSARPAQLALHVVQARAFGRGEHDHDALAVFGRRELGRQDPEQEHREHDGSDARADDQPRRMQTVAQRALVSPRQPRKNRSTACATRPRRCRARRASSSSSASASARPARRSRPPRRARSRTRGTAGRCCRAGTRSAGTRRPAPRRRDHREADLAPAVDRGDQRRLAELDAPLDVLEHHDRVVDDQADREHRAEQRQHVDREAGASP